MKFRLSFLTTHTSFLNSHYKSCSENFSLFINDNSRSLNYEGLKWYTWNNLFRQILHAKRENAIHINSSEFVLNTWVIRLLNHCKVKCFSLSCCSILGSWQQITSVFVFFRIFTRNVCQEFSLFRYCVSNDNSGKACGDGDCLTPWRAFQSA